MFSHDWKDYPAPENQLAYWLDPLKTKAKTLEGYDPNEAFWETGDTLSNIGTGEKITVEKSGLSWGSWSGHNSTYSTQFAEHFAHTQKERVLGIMLNIARNYVTSLSSRMILKIWRDEGIPDRSYIKKVFPCLTCHPIQFSLLNWIRLLRSQIPFSPVMSYFMILRQIPFQLIWLKTGR